MERDLSGQLRSADNICAGVFSGLSVLIFGKDNNGVLLLVCV